MEPIAQRLIKALPPGLTPAKSIGPVECVAHTDPKAFWEHFSGALLAGHSAAFLNPAWPDIWKQRLEEIARDAPDAGDQKILVPTSGTSAMPKFCIHDLDTLTCAAIGYAQRFAPVGLIHAVNVLPQHHVGGFMPVFRAAECGGMVHFANYEDPASMARAPFDLAEASLSLVPTQLSRLRDIHDGTKILRRFGMILIGGAACSPGLLEWARREDLRLAPCYGSTETAAMVTILEPEAFLSGASGVGSPLPHARVEIGTGHRIKVDSGSNHRGYFPAQPGFTRKPWATGDIGQLDPAGNLMVLGRADRVIISGGEKVHPELVESAAISTGLVKAARCLGVPDEEWGQRVVLEAVPVGEACPPEKLIAAIRPFLPPFACPKEIRLATALPPGIPGKLMDSGK